MATLMERRKQKVIEAIDMSIVPEFKAKRPAELPILSAPATHVRLGTHRFSDDMVVHHCLDIRTKELFLNPEIISHDIALNPHPSLEAASAVEAPAQRRCEEAEDENRAEKRNEQNLSSSSTCEVPRSPGDEASNGGTGEEDKLPVVSPLGSEAGELMDGSLRRERSESLGASSSDTPETPCNVDAASAAWGEGSLRKKRKQKDTVTKDVLEAHMEEPPSTDSTLTDFANKTEARGQGTGARAHTELEVESEDVDSPVGGSYKRRRIDP